MTYWTILFITALSGPMEGSQSVLLYPSLEACHKAAPVVGVTLGYDYAADCVESVTASRSIRPRRSLVYGG